MNKYMNIALNEAKLAYDEGNVPIGAVIVKNNKIVSVAHNLKNTSNISVYHAEILAIIKACERLGSWYLNDCILYVTLKPCEMCSAAIAEARIKNVIYLLDSNYDLNMNSNLNSIEYTKLDCDNNYSELISAFFKNIR